MKNGAAEEGVTISYGVSIGAFPIKYFIIQIA
jgi:hypothetical protein